MSSQKATDRFPPTERLPTMDFKQHPNEAVAKLQQYRKEINTLADSLTCKHPHGAVTDMPAKREYVNDPAIPMALRLKAYRVYYGFPAASLLDDTLRPLEYGFEVAPWNLEYAFNNESRFIKAIEIGKKLTTAPQCMGA